MKAKRVLGILLCLVLLTGMVFTGCSESKPATTKKKSKNVTTHSSETSKEDEIVTLSLVEKDFVPSNPDDIEYINKINDALLENGIKAKLELVELPRGGYSEKLDLMIADGKVPDIMWFRDGIDKKIAEQGLLVDLREYVGNSEVFQKSMEPYNKARLASYPYLLRIRYNTPKIAVVRKDWLEKLELDIPETVDDYYKVLRTFAGSDFDGNGEKDTYGITVTGDTSRMDNIFNVAFGMPTTWIKGEEDKYIYSKVSQNEKEKLAFYRKLMDEKILDPEYITTKWDTMEEKLYTGKVGMVIGSAGKVIEIYNAKLKNNGVDTDLIPLNPPKGKSDLSGLAPVNVSREQRGFAISALSENQDLAFKVLEFMASDKGQLLDRLGFEGRDYTKDIDGKITRTKKGEEWYARFFDVPSWKSPIPLLSDVARESLDITANYYTEDISFEIPSEHSTKWEGMNNLYKEYSYKIISGEYKLDKFDEFVQKWYAAGGDEITKLANNILK